MAQGTQTGALHHLRGTDGVGGGREGQKGGDICTPVADTCRGLAENNTIL